MTRERFLEILEWLDGRGIIITDDDLVEESLEGLNVFNSKEE
jgi:hypothetical protein